MGKSYIIKQDEKQAIRNICDIIIWRLNNIQIYSSKMESIQRKIKEFSKSDDSKCLVDIYDIYQLDLTDKLEEQYNILEIVCSDLVIIITPKIHMLDSLQKLCNIASYISKGTPLDIDDLTSEDNDEYKITSSTYKPLMLSMLIPRTENIRKTIEIDFEKLS